ncbi:3-mercaptopyruvate sulfurtransferase [Amphiplicatus metriothermophilus]|uniref:3-mercaptopyruvate sulfurtransferase n=1 Tax=Amphiplicatus metriothermophilus TaxID=1519374 RepID=A0A239PUA2_9PROT|nr:3-mercaptopyruvate sulfurtransferase [Amphiplicatus metriothermophilus]MBB5519208.1 thiosulfate/3-mercaptopyruvate sulfurtransferase [Amphiplicatus metriothermophilus]SNT73277.1 thiosulfate/3-mercaptopyruvate sulfurtransferase [Amphiplicatus metriothermophilus]
MDLPTPIVETNWLARHLGEPDLAVVDGSWRLPGQGHAREDYEKRHIPGAAFFDIDAIADRATPLPHMLPAPADFARAMETLGISSDDRVVVYDDAGLFSAARVWWTFRAMGHDAVAVLNGGLPKWIAEGRVLTDAPTRPRSGAFRARLRPELVRDAAAVRAALADGATLVLDARPAGRFEGRDPEPRAGLRFGHMPGAKNLPAGEIVNSDGTIKPPEALAALFEARGAIPGRPVITSCGSGVTAAILSLALARLGREAHGLYDGSWAEWGAADNDPALFPVVGASEPKERRG